MAKYLSIDTEATGLTEDCHLLQFALVPLDTKIQSVRHDLGTEVTIWCPSFEELLPTLNDWVKEHNEGLIRDSHKNGMSKEKFQQWIAGYLAKPEMVSFFGGERPIILGKSLSALDIPILTRYLGKPAMEKYFHHHTLDVTCVSRYLVDLGKLPAGCESTSKLIKYLGVREDANHTALSDATDMAEIYLRLLRETGMDA